MLNRRNFMAIVGAGAALGALGNNVAIAAWGKKKRIYSIDLVCGAVGIQATQQEAVELAIRHGFESVEARGAELAALGEGEFEALVTKMKDASLRFGAGGLPVDFRRDDKTFQDGMRDLPKTCEGLRRAGVARMGTWLRPTHESLTYLQNFKQHARRLKEIANVLGEYDLRFGLEYVGPWTSWTAGKHPFVHCMAETLELIEAIGEPNMGLVLDSWHWHNSEESASDIIKLKAVDVVAVDLNDAPTGLAMREFQDLSRELPAATGVIDLASFLKALLEIGYDGPVRAEPFNAPLNAMENEEAAAATSKAMKKAFALVEG